MIMNHLSKNLLKLLLIRLLVLYMSIIHTVGGNNVYIKLPTSDGCPEYETCITLSSLAANTSNFLDNTNTTIIFLEGNHTLNTDLNMRDIDHFVRLSATKSVSVSITCAYRAGLIFNNIKQLQISGLELIRCRNKIKSVDDFLLEDCHFRDGDSGSALLLTQTNTNIERCSFISNRAGTDTIVVYYNYNVLLRVGGALCVISSNLSISSSWFGSNEARGGGAMYIKTGSNISIADCVFVKNKAKRDGGALHVVSSSAVIVDNSTFINNIAAYGGAVYLHGAVFRDYQSIFHGNRAWDWGGAIDASDSRITIDRSSYSNNTSGYEGGAVHAEYSSIAMNHSYFHNNEADFDGGAIISYNSDITAYKISYDNNKAGDSGGAIRSSRSSIALHYSFFTNNEALTNGGVILATYSRDITVYSSTFDSNKAGQHGGAVRMDNSSITVLNSSFTSNTARYDGGVVYAYNSNITMNYSSFSDNQAGNDGGVIYEMFTYTTVYSSYFMNNEAGKKGGVLYKNNTLTTVFRYFIVPNNTFMTWCTYVNNSAIEGGVMYIHDALLTVVDSNYQNNRATSTGGAIFLNKGRIKVTASTFKNNTAVNSGGVVATFTQFFQNHMTFEQSDFQHNRAFSGGVIAIVANDLVAVSTSTFSNNSAARGGVIYLQTENDLTVNHSTFSHNSADNDGGVFYSGNHNRLALKNSEFTYNNAENNGGVVCSFFQTKFNITSDYNCSFVGNQAQNGGAVYASESRVTVLSKSLLMSNNSAVESGGAMYLFKSNLTIVNSKSMLITNTANNGGSLFASKSNLLVEMNSQTTVYANSATNNGGGLYLTMSELTVRGYSFHTNRNRAERIGGGIFVDNSSFIIEGETHFANNEAENGGGVGLVNSAVIIGISAENVSLINFSLNRASSYGGALYVDDNSNSDTLCSVINESIKNETTANECFSNTIFLNFSDNSANKLGSNLFGGFLDICEVNETVDSPDKEKRVASFLRKSNIDESQLDTISSHPVQLCFCREGQTDCDYQPETVRIDIGNSFSIEVTAHDQVHNAVNSTVSCSLNSSAGGLDVGQDLQSINAVCTKLYFTLYSPHNHEELTLSVDSILCKTLRITKQRIMIEIICSCPIGFQVNYNDQTSCDCVCDKVFQPYDKTDCDKQLQSIIRKDNFWIKYINTSNSSGYVIYPNCPYDYCHTPEESIAINLNNPDGYEAQCASHRSGTLCGSCKQNFSVSLGSSSCLYCPTYWPGIMVTIITAFMLSGLCLVALLLVLNITVAMGTLNAIIFYANIVAANKSAMLSSSKVRFASIFISWLNFDIGFDTCFFDGMDTYVKTWLQLAFPLYIILLVIVIIKLSYHCDAFGHLIGRRDPVATLATLVLLSYAKLLQTIITAFSSVTLVYPDHSKKNVWLPDASIEYLTGKHTALFFVALLILVAGLVYTLLLLTWQCLLRCPRRRIRLIMSQKLSSFLQTYHVPYTPKHRYWTGLLLLVRVSIYLISGFNPTGDPRISLLSTAIILSFLFLYTNVFRVRIYKNCLINATEMITYFNIIAVSVLTWYAFDLNHKSQLIIINISVGITFIQLLLVVFYHILKYLTSKLYSRIQELSTIKKMNERLIPREKKKFDDKPIPADGDIHQFNELVDMIDRPVNTNDYNVPQVRPRPAKPTVTKSEVELPKPYLAPPPPPPLEEMMEEPEVETEQQASEEDHVILGEENHSLLINKNKQNINDYCGIEIPEHINFYLVASGTGMDCNNKGQVIKNSISNNPITVEVEVHFSMDRGKSLEDETTVTPLIDNMQQVESTAPEFTAPVPETTAPESTAHKSTVPESTTPESTAPESTAPESTAPESTAPESTAPESTAPESTAPDSTAPESTAPESTAPESTAPESTAPDSTAPESTAPESTAPDPESNLPGSIAPEVYA